MNEKYIDFLIVLLVILIGCNKNNDSAPGGGDNDDGNNTGSKDTICVISRISQTNSGANAEFSLSAYYNNKYQINRLVSYDSAKKIQNFEIVFNYITADSIRLSSFQHIILDTNNRVVRFVTKSDLADPVNADNYIFEYEYNSKGFLATKNLFINDSKLPNLKTIYTYTGNLLTNCLMIAVSSGNLKVLESTLSYDNSFKIKNWIYTFPDAMEGYYYFNVLNFGNHGTNPLERIITRIYNPSTGKLLDTWTTTYGNYKIDTKGYIISGEAIGDLQQGLSVFYGKTSFYFRCH